jgi:HSP20 family protein
LEIPPKTHLLPVDEMESDGTWTVSADLPGFNRTDIAINVNTKANTLHIKADRQRAAGTEGGRSERVFGVFERILAMPASVDSSKSVRVDFSNGVLSLDFPTA